MNLEREGLVRKFILRIIGGKGAANVEKKEWDPTEKNEEGTERNLDGFP